MSTDDRQATADKYYAEGCAQVDLNTVAWEKAHDPALPPSEQAMFRAQYETGSARAQSLFKRHDMILDSLAKDTKA